MLIVFAPFINDLVRHVRRGLHQVDIGFVLQPLLDDLHVQQSEKSAAKAEAERIARLGLELEARIVDRQTLERVTQFAEVLAVTRKQTAVNHPLGAWVSGQRFRGIVARDTDRVANVNIADALDVADQVADLARLQFVARLRDGE